MKKSHKIGFGIGGILILIIIIFLFNNNNNKTTLLTNQVIQEACAIGEFGIAYDETGEQFNEDIMLDAMNNYAEARRRVSISAGEILTLMGEECPSYIYKFIVMYQE